MNRSIARKPLREGDDLVRQTHVRAGNLAPDDRQLALGVRIVDPVIEAASLDRVVDLARAIGGDDDDRRLGALDRAEFRNRDLILGQHFEQICLEGLVGAVEFVDQEHRRDAVIGLERLQQRTADQEALGKDVGRERVLVDLALRLGEPDLDHLARIVPLVDRRCGIEALVALQPHQRAAERARQHLGDLGLADPASPSRNSGRRSFSARKTLVASRRSLK